MWALLLPLLFQFYFDRPILEAEDARAEQPATIINGLKSTDSRIQRLAVRAAGRLERPELADAVRPLLAAGDAGVRMEAVNALGQMNAALDASSLLAAEPDGRVRGVIYETGGRLRDMPAGVEGLLAGGLKDTELAARRGAAKGLEALFRTHRNAKPAPETLAALRDAFKTNPDAQLRELVLLTLNASADADAEVIRLAFEDPEPQVRRLAVLASKQWKDDPSYIVRYEALKVSPSCERAAALVRDPSDHVALLAIDLLGNKCNPRLIERIVDTEKDWRKQAHGIVALAKVDPESARKRLPRIADHEVWQARVYGAEAAKILKDDRTLARLARDNHPNVMAATIMTPRDSLRYLDATHYGLLFDAARKMKDWEDGRLAVTNLLAALERISRDHKANSRDARLELLHRLGEFGDVRVAGGLRPYLSDPDPAVAKLAALIVSDKSGVAIEPITRRYTTKPVPSERVLLSLAGATAEIRMREAGAFTIELMPEEAPLTVAVFTQLAQARYYNGLTMHRIVPNFVLQGGSPGASEYVGAADFMRDELGLPSHRRGTLGISTRGRDTGDAQIFINLIDNFRLDHNYTVFANVIQGMENVDRIQEGDVIEAIEIRRKVQP
jgi:cyclophilin family peptidyl-prolyl cis-trans isomerase